MKHIHILKKSINRSLLRLGFLVVPLVFACVALVPAPNAFGVNPPPDGGHANGNTAEGTDALFHLTIGNLNTAIGVDALFSLTTGNDNTALGAAALVSNTTGSDNTAVGVDALLSNTTGIGNTATGFLALESNTSGTDNTANGTFALVNNQTGTFNTATGAEALQNNTLGGANTATGVDALQGNTTGNGSTATGVNALLRNTTGNGNTATGLNALSSNTIGKENTAEGSSALLNNTTGNNNVALGTQAGKNLTNGSNNIIIGANVLGNAKDTGIIRIGNSAQTKTFIGGISGKTVAGGVGIIINASGQLGTIQSSARFKDDIKPMDKVSEALLKLRPVTFHYKKELDSDKIPQFGLIAEEVEKVNPNLVVRDEEGKVTTVRYEAVNAMLLNEFLKEHRKEQDLEATVAQQQKEIKALTASLKEQAAQIQKVSDRVELGKATAQLVVNNQSN